MLIISAITRPFHFHSHRRDESPKRSRSAKSKDNPWYHESISGEVSAQARELLEDYAGIPANQVDDHIYKIRDHLWRIAPYPCIGQFRFLSLNLSKHPRYNEVLKRIQAGQKFLDVPCCVGQDIRKLIHDGAPAANITGTDLFPSYLTVGFDLFRDRHATQATYFPSDLLDADGPLSEYHGRFDIVHAGLFLHLFDWKHQVLAIVKIIRLLNPSPGSLFLGQNVGYPGGRERRLQSASSTGRGHMVYLHDSESFRRLWQEVEHITHTKWHVQVDELSRDDHTINGLPRRQSAMEDDGTYFGSSSTWLVFSAERL